MINCYTPQISIHALREEGDSTPARRRSWLIYFYPRPPRGGRPKHAAAKNDGPKFLSTPSARRATHVADTICSEWLISIHALREEGDLLLQTYMSPL